MAMAAKRLASGKLPTTKGNLYVCPAGNTAKITGITIVNLDSGDHTYNIYSNELISAKDEVIGAGKVAIDSTERTLTATQAIEGIADAANMVSYVIDGYEGVA